MHLILIQVYARFFVLDPTFRRKVVGTKHPVLRDDEIKESLMSRDIRQEKKQ